jgi:hypothetical protein
MYKITVALKHKLKLMKLTHSDTGMAEVTIYQVPSSIKCSPSFIQICPILPVMLLVGGQTDRHSVSNSVLKRT